MNPPVPEPAPMLDPTPAQRVASLAPMLGDSDPRVRKSAVIALGRLSCPEATGELCRMLGDVAEGVRVLVCQALGRAADPASVPALLERVHDTSAEVRAGVLWALANVVAHGGLDDDARAALFTPVVVLAFDPDDGVRADAAAVIGSLRDPRATDALTVLLEDACPRVRANAAASLGLTDDAAGLQALLLLAENPGEDVLARVSALDGLARRASRGSVVAGSPEAARALDLALALACDECPELAQTATWSLGLLVELAPTRRDEVRTRLVERLAAGDVWVSRYAVESLARLHDGASAEALRAFAAALPADADPELAAALNQALELLQETGSVKPRNEGLL